MVVWLLLLFVGCIGDVLLGVWCFGWGCFIGFFMLCLVWFWGCSGCVGR